MRRSLLFPTAILPLLAACGGTSTAQPPIQSVSARPVPATKPPRPQKTWQSPKIMNLPGLEGVIGANAATLGRQFGQARLDIWEGDVHKLQFSGNACVLDVYLYPPAPKSEPTATYVDARRPSDGQDVDRASCVAALRR